MLRRRATGKACLSIGKGYKVLTALNSLQSILKKRTIAPAKLDEVKIKANILSTFKVIEEKVEEVIEEVKETVEEAIGRDEL